MKIAINVRFLIPGKMEGFGRLTYEIVKELISGHPEDSFYLLFDRPHHDKFYFGENVTNVVLAPPARHPVLWYLWFEYAVNRALAAIRPDVFFSPDGYTCLRTEVKTLLMVHDISFIHFPKHVPFLVGRYYNYFMPKFLERADRLITLSEHALRDISAHYGVPQDKFALTILGSQGAFRPVSRTVKRATLAKYSDGKPYFLYVGAINPRKNVGRLIEAFTLFKGETGADFKLLIVGNYMYGREETQQAYRNSLYKNDILFTGYLDRELYDVVGSAHALTYVSLYEGFGMPLVEAMYCHVPSITSNVSSMPEVAGKTGILVDPTVPGEIAEAMITMVRNEEKYQEMVAECRLRKQQYRWRDTARDVYSNLRRLHESGNG